MAVNMDNVDYEKSKKYWSEIEATDDGVLGGFGFISQTDIKGSLQFINQLRQRDGDAPYFERALDVGAGIGRVSKYVLSPNFGKVDLLEQDEKFMKTAKRILQASVKPGPNSKKGRPNCEHFFCSGIMEFNFPGVMYDVIWIQWVLGYLKDDDVVEFLKRCCTWLNHNGVIVIKENLSQMKEGEIDETDSSITRSIEQYYNLFHKTKLKCILKTQQRDFPKGLYKVLIFGLRPVDEPLST